MGPELWDLCIQSFREVHRLDMTGKAAELLQGTEGLPQQVIWKSLGVVQRRMTFWQYQLPALRPTRML